MKCLPKNLNSIIATFLVVISTSGFARKDGAFYSTSIGMINHTTYHTENTDINANMAPIVFYGKFGRKLFQFGTEVHFSPFQYENNGLTKKGYFNAIGINVGFMSNVGKNNFFREFGDRVIRATLGYYPYSTLSLASNDTITVNDEFVSRKTLSSLTGSMGLSFNLNFILTKKPFVFRKANLDYGIGLTALHQRFSKKRDLSTQSSENLGVTNSDNTTESDIRLNVISINLILGFRI